MVFYTADLCDELGENVQVLDYGYHAYGGRRAFKGKIATVILDEDNTPLIELLNEKGEGRVCVIDVSAKYVAVVGENLMKLAKENGWSGMVVHGYIRDIVFTQEIDVGLIALGTCPQKSSKKARGIQGEDISFGGVTFVVGDMLYADDDGVITTHAV